jgi:DNA-binding CsgD family transcriptional regulator
VAEATGIARPAYGAAAVAAWRGREAEATPLIRSAAAAATQRREGIGLTLIHYTDAVLQNGLGNHAAARSAALSAVADPAETAFASWALAELVEAAVRTGDLPGAVDAVERLARTTTPSGTEWSLGVEARSRALVAGPSAEALYREAIDRLARSRGVVALARAHLVFGEWLSSQGRRPEARAQLRKAYEMCSSIGAEAFAGRARLSLQAIGDSVPRLDRPTAVELTPQERQIARRARDGRSNPEIAAELFLSARTVEWHLRKVFTKLGIGSRRELRDVLIDTRQERAA